MSRDNSTVSAGSRKKIEQYSYCLGDKIGKGYSSVVYRGRNDDSNEAVAIKVIDMKSIRDSIAKQMLHCEMEALKTLKHPNVLCCHDIFTTANNCYIITELCSEGDLASLIKTRKRLSETEANSFIADIMAGFLEIADKNYLHRDLKLANILLSKGAAKIADFGFAKKNVNPGEREKYNVGSPLYMSPQALKRNIYSIKNDIWSIGVIIYELLHGETPWECRTEKELLDKMVRIPVRFSSSVKVSEDLKEFIKKCLEVDQTRRIGVDGIKNYPHIKKLLSERTSDAPTPSILALKAEQQPKLSLKPTDKMQRTQTLKPSTSNNKQNIPNGISKVIVQKNNTAIIFYINRFRLLYKILQQLKQIYPTESELIQCLSNQVLGRVSEMNEMCVGKVKTTLPEIMDSDKYFNETINPGFKKYRAVVSEYYRKYNEELKKETVSGTLDRKLKDLLKNTKVLPEKHLTWFHWIVEYLLLPKDIKKNYIENIIEPDLAPSEESVRNRMKLII